MERADWRPAEGASIFSIFVHSDGTMESPSPERFNGVESRAAKHMRDETFVMIGKNKVVAGSNAGER